MPATAPVTITGGESSPAVPVPARRRHRLGRADDEGRPTAGAADRRSAATSPATQLDHREHRARSVLREPCRFTFKAGCPSALDCAAPEPLPRPPGGGPAIDYLAKDYAQLPARAARTTRRLATRAWVERDEADLGMMLAELLSAVGDDLSYQQDRIAAEATLATATQRRSAVRHARLVDYEPPPATSAPSRCCRST